MIDRTATILAAVIHATLTACHAIYSASSLALRVGIYAALLGSLVMLGAAIVRPFGLSWWWGIPVAALIIAGWIGYSLDRMREAFAREGKRNG